MVFRKLPTGVDGYHATNGRLHFIALSRTLSQSERNETLAHELIHAERGGGPLYSDQPAGWDDVVSRDEAAVGREVARRLVPADDLAALIAQTVDLGESVDAVAVAEHFDVSEPVAQLALELLRSGGAA